MLNILQYFSYSCVKLKKKNKKPQGLDIKWAKWRVLLKTNVKILIVIRILILDNTNTNLSVLILKNIHVCRVLILPPKIDHFRQNGRKNLPDTGPRSLITQYKVENGWKHDCVWRAKISCVKKIRLTSYFSCNKKKKWCFSRIYVAVMSSI